MFAPLCSGNFSALMWFCFSYKKTVQSDCQYRFFPLFCLLIEHFYSFHKWHFYQLSVLADMVTSIQAEQPQLLMEAAVTCEDQLSKLFTAVEA